MIINIVRVCSIAADGWVAVAGRRGTRRGHGQRELRGLRSRHVAVRVRCAMCDVRGHARIGDTGRAIAPQWTDLAGGSDDTVPWGRKRGGMRDGTVGDERASACPIGEKRLGEAGPHDAAAPHGDDGVRTTVWHAGERTCRALVRDRV